MMEFIKDVAAEAGRLALAGQGGLRQDGIEFKNERDIVTSVDRRVEEFIAGRISKEFPSHAILGEEGGLSGDLSSDYCWAVDPIDGTTSFVHGQPFFSVSIALRHKGAPVASAVCAPRLGELYWAERGKGAYLGGERLQVSRRDKLIHSVLSTGFACIRAGQERNNLPLFNRILPRLRGVRRYGSAAIDMAYVAAGRLEGFWELNLNLYDIAAGELLVLESGGRVMDFEGGSGHPQKGTLATNGLIDAELLPLLAGG